MTEVNLALARWYKSKRSEGGSGCVEVARVNDLVAVRHSRHPDGPILIFNIDQWRTFIDALKQGTFDNHRS